MLERAEAVRNVVDLQQIFPKSFAIYGTALGSLRENNVIEHDLDTDMGIFVEDFNWSQVTEAIKQGFGLVAIFGMWHYGMEIAFRRDGVKTDLMLFYRDKENAGKVFNCLWKNGGRNGMDDVIIHEYDEEMMRVQEGQLGDELIRTLGEKYIIHVYGQDWRTPVRRWNWQTDHLCKKTG